MPDLFKSSIAFLSLAAEDAALIVVSFANFVSAASLFLAFAAASSASLSFSALSDNFKNSLSDSCIFRTASSQTAGSTSLIFSNGIPISIYFDNKNLLFSRLANTRGSCAASVYVSSLAKASVFISCAKPNFLGK